MSQENKQAQKSALIVGGGRGMGAAVARRLHSDGWHLTLMSPSESCEKLASELTGAQAVRGSAGEAEDLARAVAKAQDFAPHLDAVLLHTAGPPKGELLALSDDDWSKGHQLVVLSFVRLARLTVPLLAKQGGSFVTIGAFGCSRAEFGLSDFFGNAGTGGGTDSSLCRSLRHRRSALQRGSSRLY